MHFLDIRYDRDQLNIESNSMFCRCSTRYALLFAVGVIISAAFLLSYRAGQSEDDNLFNVTVVSDVLNSLVKYCIFNFSRIHSTLLIFSVSNISLAS